MNQTEPAFDRFQLRQIDTALRAWGGWSGQVHSVFESCCNLITGKGFISVLAYTEDPPPYAMVTDSASFYPLVSGVQVGQSVTCDDQSLRIGRNALVLKGAQLYDSKGPQGTTATQNSAGYLRQLILGRRDMPQVHPFYAIYERNCEEFIASWVSGTPDAKKLIGLGNGLTPSGDDFLAGFYIASVYVNPADSRAAALASAFENLGFGQTTDVSAAMLRAAAEYRARPSVWKLLEGLAAGDETRARDAFEQLSAVGSSSGLDWCDGMLAALELCR